MFIPIKPDFVLCHLIFNVFGYICSLFRQMKFISIILSFYVLMLTAIPCIDAPVHDCMNKTDASQGNQHSHHQNDSDRCSPFCTCNCCATSVIFQDVQVQLSCFSFIEIQYFPLSTGFFSDSLASIWQPPKIA